MTTFKDLKVGMFFTLQREMPEMAAEELPASYVKIEHELAYRANDQFDTPQKRLLPRRIGPDVTVYETAEMNGENLAAFQSLRNIGVLPGELPEDVIAINDEEYDPKVGGIQYRPGHVDVSPKDDPEGYLTRGVAAVLESFFDQAFTDPKSPRLEMGEGMVHRTPGTIIRECDTCHAETEHVADSVVVMPFPIETPNTLRQGYPPFDATLLLKCTVCQAKLGVFTWEPNARILFEHLTRRYNDAQAAKAAKTN